MSEAVLSIMAQNWLWGSQIVIKKDSINLGGRYIRGRGSGAPIRRSDNRVLVSGLPPTGSWQDLKDHMREAGEVLYTDVYKDGTAVVEFSKYSDMKWAVKYLDDSEFESHQVLLFMYI